LRSHFKTVWQTVWLHAVSLATQVAVRLAPKGNKPANISYVHTQSHSPEDNTAVSQSAQSLCRCSSAACGCAPGRAPCKGVWFEKVAFRWMSARSLQCHGVHTAKPVVCLQVLQACAVQLLLLSGTASSEAFTLQTVCRRAPLFALHHVRRLQGCARGLDATGGSRRPSQNHTGRQSKRTSPPVCGERWGGVVRTFPGCLTRRVARGVHPARLKILA